MANTVTYVTKQIEPSATTETVLYTVPTVVVSKIVNIFVCNKGAAGTFRISQSVGGGATADKDYIFYDEPLAANTTYRDTSPLFGNTGDIFRVYASSADISFTLHAQETAEAT